ncbi:S100P-binding protein isoform X1 [Poecilia formosa]|uniref:S100P-binding protein n=1 Tax=Poecilia formosa TaxID=48698 RepID=A0A096MAS2_POEFO|nr:PREDICTED: S100P-binding protein isoform X1 [Poecilia formosa]
MDNESSANTIVSRQNPPSKNHLKPLSVYSRRVMCDQQKGPRSPVEPPDPFVNFKIKIVNDSGRKRKLGHSGTINDYNSPLKKQCSSNALSPDLGCFMDYSSSLTRNNSLSPFAAPYPVLKEETADRSVTKETVSSRLDLEHVQCGCSKEEVEKTEKIVKNMSSVFDNDINEILCLNPPKLELVKPNIKEEKPDAGPVEDDRGYLSSVLHSEECKTEDPPEQLGHEQASTGAPHFSFLIKDSSETVTGPLLGPVKCDGSFLEGEDEVFNIGQPIFESSICQPSAEAEQKSGLSEALRTVNVSQTYNSGDYTVDTLYETTLPLQVQVKSKVVVPGQSEGISKPATSTQSEQKTSSADKKRDKAVKRGRGHRPKILDNSMEWEHHKRQYIFSVKSHMTENPGRAQGPMTELLDLMTHVAGQTGSNGSQWQHPSDLTCRNYQKRFGNETPTMTLSEWQAQNNTHHRRFSKVPKIFERSPYP